MPTFYRVLLGRGSSFASECIAGNYIGVDFDISIDFTGTFSDSYREFNKRYIPIYQQNHTVSSISAGIACGAIYVIGRQMQNGDYVISPMGNGTYRIGQINGDYHYVPNTSLPHRRGVSWLSRIIQKEELSQQIIKSIHSQMTVINVSIPVYIEELQGLISNLFQPIPNNDDLIEFALESQLEEFILENWQITSFGREFNIHPDGQQFTTDVGKIDILAISKNQKRYLVIELKKGRGSDEAVGQILRYMSYVKDVLAQNGETVHGAIIASTDDLRIRRALSMVQNVTFYRYRVTFALDQLNSHT